MWTSTYCRSVQQWCSTNHKQIHITIRNSTVSHIIVTQSISVETLSANIALKIYTVDSSREYQKSLIKSTLNKSSRTRTLFPIYTRRRQQLKPHLETRWDEIIPFKKYYIHEQLITFCCQKYIYEILYTQPSIYLMRCMYRIASNKITLQNTSTFFLLW
jgi:hypothetical protein